MKKIATLFYTSILMATLLFSHSIKAQSITTQASDIIFNDVTLTAKVLLHDGSVQTELKRVSYGLRQKKVFLLAVVKIYVAEFFAARPEKLQKNNEFILSSLKSAGPLHLRIS